MNKVRLKYIFNIQKGRLTDEDVNGATLLDVEYLRGGSNPRKVSLANAVYSKGGDLLMLWDGSKAGELLWSKEGVVGSTLALLELIKDINTGYAYYFLKSKQGYIQDLSTGMGIPHVDGEILRNLLIDLPGVDRQEAIAMYLNRITAVIDKIITTKNHTHTYLLELRQAIITDAVLGRGSVGVNYRQTNIPWIGKIPAHWQVRRIKHVANIVLGKMLQSAEKEGYQYKKYLRAQNIRWEEVSIESANKMWFSLRELSVYRLKEGDILVSEGGEVGRAAMWRNELSECYIQNSVNRLRVNESVIDPKYLLYVVEGIGQAKVFENTVNRVSIAHLTREKLKEYSIPLPPLNEQRAIVKGIEESLRKIDKSVNGLQKSIDLLTEYRSSLISNVINGKVKV